MLSLLSTSPLIFIISFATLIISITIHEFAHALVADRLGDPTPRAQGRLTLNPLAHLDPVGTILMLLTRFGWGKPVQFDPYNLKNPVSDAAMIALAGPSANLILATLLSLILHLTAAQHVDFLAFVLTETILLNIVLAIFNLIPIYPLDGSKIFLALLPRELAETYDAFMRQFGFLILIVLLIFPLISGETVISVILSPALDFLQKLLIG